MNVPPDLGDEAHRGVEIISAAGQCRGVDGSGRGAGDDGKRIGAPGHAGRFSDVGNGLQHADLIGRARTAAAQHKASGCRRRGEVGHIKIISRWVARAAGVNPNSPSQARSKQSSVDYAAQEKLMNLTEQTLMDALKSVLDPNTGGDFVASKCIKNLTLTDGDVAFDVELGYPAKSQIPGIRKALIAAGKGVDGVNNVSVNVSMALAAEGASVGLLDADIYGPSIPMMMGIDGRPESEDGQTMEPLENYGVQVMSIGFLVAQDEAMIWRGPMATQALEQLLRQTNWRDLDYLIVDMPPGTGDIQLTLSQRVPMTGAVIVTTPQDIALMDAKKGIKMFEKVGVPILGIVENMAVHVCSQCGHTEHIFGADGGKKMAADYNMDYLGALPLDMQIRLQADSGKPTVVADPDGDVAAIYKAVARKVAITVAAKAKDFSAKFPTITISKNT